MIQKVNSWWLMTKQQVGFTCLLLLASAAGISQTNRSITENIGAVVAYKKVTGGIEGRTRTAKFEVRAYNDQTIRVNVTKERAFRSLPYALQNTAVPNFNGGTVTEKGNTIVLATAALEVVIEKSPAFRIVFKNKQGTVINEDVPGSCFGTTFIGDKVSVYKKLQEGERFVGMGEALGNLDRRGSLITLNNTDTYKYGDPRLSMYVSVPFYIGIHHQQQYGIFYNNSYRSVFNFGVSTPDFASANFDGGDADYFFLYDSTVAGILQQYTGLTGRMQLPPKWGIGYHQSRCSYYPQSKVEWIARSFREKKIPLDCIVLDADYQQGYQPFRVNQQRFPDMPALAASLAKQHIELTASVYPGVAIDSSYHSYTDGLKKDVFIQYADGSLFNTEIAPVKCYLPDYTNPVARQWWKDKMKWLPNNGIHGYWNDMNEPALGSSYLPDNLLFDFDGKKANALEAKNLYGFQMARSSYEAALQNSPARRPFILTRSGFAGVQRYSAVWSGDNTSSDEGMLSSVLLNNQLGLSGIAFCGHDIGGFIGDGSKELYRRWIQVGVFSPFCRNHKGCGGTVGEPWAYGDEAEAISKNYIGFRYRLMPYLYAAFHEAAATGMPVARSLCINYPHDGRVYDSRYQQQFLFGNGLLVVPVTSPATTAAIFLPPGSWYNLCTDEALQGDRELTVAAPAHRLPLYVKAGAIVPEQTLVQHAAERPGDTLLLHVYYGNTPGSFVYYEDEGEGMGYQQQQYCRRRIEFDPVLQQVRLSAQEGNFTSVFKKITVVLHGAPNQLKSVVINSKDEQQWQPRAVKLLDPLQYLDDIYDPGYFRMLAADEQLVNISRAVTIDNSNTAITLQLR